MRPQAGLAVCIVLLIFTLAANSMKVAATWKTEDGYNFDVEITQLSPKARQGELLNISIAINNTGSHDGIAEYSFAVVFPNSSKLYLFAANSNRIDIGARWYAEHAWNTSDFPLGKSTIVVDIYATGSSTYPDYAVASVNGTFAVYESLVVGESEVYPIEDSEYDQYGNITVKENGTLIVRNSTLNVVQEHGQEYWIFLYDNATMIVENAEIRSNAWLSLHVNCNSRLTFNSSIGHFGDLWCFDNSKVLIINSSINVLACRANSSVLVHESAVECVTCGVNVRFTSIGSTLNTMEPVACGSDLLSLEFNPGWMVDTNFTKNSNLNFTFQETQVKNWGLTVGGNASISLSNSTMEYIRLGFEIDSKATVKSLPRGAIAFWNLYDENIIEKSYMNLTVTSAYVAGRRVASTGNATVLVTNIRESNSSMYDIEVYDNSSMHVSNSSFHNVCCWNGTLASENSIFAGDVSCHGGSNTELSYVTVSNDIDCYDSSFTLIANSVVDRAINGWQHSTIQLINMVTEKVKIYDEAHAFANWVLTVRVLAGQDIVENAEIQVVLINGTSVAEAETGWNGTTNLVLLGEIMHFVNGTKQIDYVGNYTVKVDPPSSSPNTTKYLFLRWSEDLDSDSNPAQLAIEKPMSVVAELKKQCFFQVFPKHGTADGTGWYDYGSNATYSINQTIFDHGNGSRHVFDGWEGGLINMNTSGSVIVDKPIAITANWKVQYYLSVNSTAEYGTTNGTDWYDNGAVAGFSIVESIIDYSNGTRNKFDRWTGDYNSNSLSGNITIVKPTNITAGWETQQRLIIESELGTTEQWIDANTYWSISVNRTISDFWLVRQFKGWSGDLNDTASEATILMTTAYKIQANWETLPSPISFIVAVLLSIFASYLLRKKSSRKIVASVTVFVIAAVTTSLFLYIVSVMGSIRWNLASIWCVCIIEFTSFILLPLAVNTCRPSSQANYEGSLTLLWRAREIVIGGVGIVCALLFILSGIIYGLPWPEIGVFVTASIGITGIGLTVCERTVRKGSESINLRIDGLTLIPHWYDNIRGCKKIKGYTGYFEVVNKGKKIVHNLTAEIGIGRSMGHYAEILEPTLMKYVTEKLHAKKIDIEDIHEDHADRIAYEWFDEEKYSYGRILPKIREEDRVFVAFPQKMGSFVDWKNEYPRSILLVSGREHKIEVVIKAEDSEKNTIIGRRIFKVTGPPEDDASAILVV